MSLCLVAFLPVIHSYYMPDYVMVKHGRGKIVFHFQIKSQSLCGFLFVGKCDDYDTHNYAPYHLLRLEGWKGLEWEQVPFSSKDKDLGKFISLENKPECI